MYHLIPPIASQLKYIIDVLHQRKLIQLVDVDHCLRQFGLVMLGSCHNLYIWRLFLLFVSVYIVQLLQVTIEF